MALYGIFLIPLLSLLPLIAGLTVHPLLDRVDAAKHRRPSADKAARVAAHRRPAPVPSAATANS